MVEGIPISLNVNDVPDTDIHLRLVETRLFHMGGPGKTACGLLLYDVPGRYTLDFFRLTCEECKAAYGKSPEPENPPEITGLVPGMTAPTGALTIEVKIPTDLTKEQWERVRSKMYIVAEIAQRATNAMVKGTVKYNADKHTKEEWIEHGLQDSMDAAIYPYFVRDEQWHGDSPTMPRGWILEPYVSE